MKLTVFFSKTNKYPNIDDYDEIVSDAQFDTNYTLTIGKAISTSRFGNATYYLGIASNMSGIIELSYTFTA